MTPTRKTEAPKLKVALDQFLSQSNPRERIAFDPIELVHRYRAPRDIEVSALLAASLAYGRVDLFKPKVALLLQRMGQSPADFVCKLDVHGARKLLEGFVYRFNVATDVAVLLLGMGRALQQYGTLEKAFLRGMPAGANLRSGLERFLMLLRQVPMAPLRRALGQERGLQHLLPVPLGQGAAKRLNLFLRWMVRGPDGVDFGIWRGLSPSQLVIPLDTHIHRMGLRLGLTRRKTMDWRTAQELTSRLAQLDGSDPVKYDFALCHYGMSGACPLKPAQRVCTKCALLPACGVGRRMVGGRSPLAA